MSLFRSYTARLEFVAGLRELEKQEEKWLTQALGVEDFANAARHQARSGMLSQLCIDILNEKNPGASLLKPSKPRKKR